MADKKKSFILYVDRKKELDMLTDEQAGKLFKAVFEYVDSGNEPDFDELVLSIMFSVFKSQLDANAEKYEEICKKRSENGKKGGRPKKEESNCFSEKAKKANGFSENQSKAKKADTDTDTDTETVTDTGTVSQSSETEKTRQTDRRTSPKNQNAFSKPMAFSVMLYNLGSPLYQEGFQSEDELENYDIEERDVQNCKIPDSFRHNLQTMQNALKYLTGYSNLKEGTFRDFTDAVILCLSEIICFGTDNDRLVANPESILDYLNEINRTVSLGTWIESLSFKYSRILGQKAAAGEFIRNRHAFLKICAVNYLKEYRAESLYPGFKN